MVRFLDLEIVDMVDKSFMEISQVEVEWDLVCSAYFGVVKTKSRLKLKANQTILTSLHNNLPEVIKPELISQI